RYTVPLTSKAADSASSGVMVTLTPALVISAAVSSVQMWVWVSIVRCLTISSPEKLALIVLLDSLTAAATGRTQAPVGRVLMGYKNARKRGRPTEGAQRKRQGGRDDMTGPAGKTHAPRVEDDALVRGNGRFMDDPRLPNTTFAAFVRSPHAHARVLKIDTEAAAKAKKVLAVLTAADIKAAGIGGISRHPPVVGKGGAKMAM